MHENPFLRGNGISVNLDGITTVFQSIIAAEYVGRELSRFSDGNKARIS